MQPNPFNPWEVAEESTTVYDPVQDKLRQINSKIREIPPVMRRICSHGRIQYFCPKSACKGEALDLAHQAIYGSPSKPPPPKHTPWTRSLPTIQGRP